MAGISEAIVGLAGVVVGGAITTTGTIWTQRLQARSTLAAEHRAREISASSTALDTLGQLLQLPDEPDSDPEQQEWTNRHHNLVILLDISTQDLQRKDLRDRMSQVCQVLELHTGAGFLTGQTERTIRTTSCSHALQCLGAFRRREPLPTPPPQHTDALESIKEWLSIETSKKPAA